MKYLYIIISSHFFLTTIIAQDTSYFNQKWKVCEKEEASYYRITQKASDNLYQINDYYLNGQIQYQGNSSTESEPFQLEGKVTYYFENGVISQEANYQNNLLNGKFIQYYPNGQIKKEAEYSLNILNGNFFSYYPNGTIYEKYHFINNELDGEAISYTSPDQKSSRAFFKNGLMDGDYEFYYRGKLRYKGYAKNGIQEGTCYEYEEGVLWKQYTISNKLMNGFYYEFEDNGDTLIKGFFENGIPIYYYGHSIAEINGSIFTNEMHLVDHIEYWKTYRDGILILESYYNEGIKTGLWKMYSLDGKSIFKTKQYPQSKSGDEYLQELTNEFNANFQLTSRFSFNEYPFEKDENNNENSKSNQHISTDRKNDPFYAIKHDKSYYSKLYTQSDLPTEIEYTEYSKSTEFISRNNCITPFEKYYDVTYCERFINGFHYKVFTSLNKATLIYLKSKLKVADDEIILLYQQFKDGTYSYDDKPPTRFMEFLLSASMIDALKSKIVADDLIIYTYESIIFDVAKFSGTSAYEALEDAYQPTRNED